MVRYVPRFADGQKVKLAWPLAVFRLNHIFWPLDPSTGKWGRYLDKVLAVAMSLVFMQHNDAELRYLRFEASNRNLDAFLTGMPTYLILVEAQFRSLHILLHFEKLQKFLEIFYANIYIDPRKEPEMFRKNPMANYIYAIWFGAKTVELLSLGQIGSDLAFTTDSLSTMYYLTHWEQILQYSTNPGENLRLLKLINLAIERAYLLSRGPFYVTGLKYISR
ncbi:GD21947 [Drosophila simulans]|uniref:GD21947 n=1 Tax=Drosophila simulans TaxID=7240 RepID=B4Q6G6_DROSI|nr:GD21947 [Drosophila simulans]